jgi:hypothetical protein
MLDNAMLKDVAGKKIVTPVAKREAAAHLGTVYGVSQRRACQESARIEVQCVTAANELMSG